VGIGICFLADGYFAEATFSSELTFVTPEVLRESAMARPIWSADFALPFRVTSPLCASTSICDAIAARSESACSLPLIIVTRTESSVLPVGAPTTVSLVRTIVTPRSRSDWMSAAARCSSVMRVLMSVLAVVLVLVPLLVESAASVLEDEVVLVSAGCVVVEVALPLLVVSLATVEPVLDFEESCALSEPLALVLPVALRLPEAFVEELVLPGDCVELLVVSLFASVEDFAFVSEEDLADVSVEAVWLLRSWADVSVVELLLLGLEEVDDVPLRFWSFAASEDDDVSVEELGVLDVLELNEPLPLAEPDAATEPLAFIELFEVEAVGAPERLRCADVLLFCVDWSCAVP